MSYTYTVTIDTDSKNNGITAAREEYNSNLSPVYDEDNNEVVPNPNLIGTNEEYVNFVMNRAADSYAHQYNT